MRAVASAVSEEETLTDQGEPTTTPPEARIPHLFVVLECARPEAGSARHSLARIDRVVLARRRTRSAERTRDGARWTLTVGLPDSRVSSDHAWLEADGGQWFVEDRGSRNGTRINGRRATERAALSPGDVVEVGHTLLRFDPGLPTPVGAAADADVERDEGAPPLLRTVLPGLARQAELLGRVIESGSSVLLRGETGTGKEVLARAIHVASRRRGPFVAVNCGALPGALVESQLFGHVRGAFSGALSDALGLVRSADGGTLLLDEIGDLPPPSQAALLRVLQEREVVPVGGSRPAKVDLLVLAATHRALDDLVARGEFRADLYARLAAFTFSIPPLRERREDVGVMIQAYAQSRPVRFTPAAGRALLRYPWPFNVRELHQTLAVAAALAGREPIDVAHLPAAVASAPETPTHEEVDVVRERLVGALARHSGNVSEAARDLGKARSQVQRWMRRYGVDARGFRS